MIEDSKPKGTQEEAVLYYDDFKVTLPMVLKLDDTHVPPSSIQQWHRANLSNFQKT